MGRDLLAVALLAALAVGFLWPCTLAGKVMLPGDLLLIMEPWRHYAYQFPEFRRVSNPILDAVQQFYPWRNFAGQSLRCGEIPLWNPYELSGNPFVGNNQSAVFYPETWMHAIMPTERALGWATALYFWISGTLMYWFLRVLGLRRVACLLGAIAFMFNGYIVGWLCFPSFRSVPGWLPGMLGGLELWRRTSRPAWLALCGLCTGLQFLAGNLHISLYVLLMFGAFAAWRAWEGWHDRSAVAWAAVLVGAAGALVLGVLLAAAQLLPTLELVRLSSRAAGGSYQGLLACALPWQNLLCLLMPDLLGNPVDYNHWGATLGKVYRAYTESAMYIGVAPLLFAPLALISRRREATLWLGVAVGGALLAVGTHLNALLYYLIPGFKALSGIGRAVIMVATGASIAGAIGLDSVLADISAQRRRAVCRVALSALTLGLLGVIGGMWIWTATGGLEAELPGIGNYTLLQIARFALFLLVAVVGAFLIGQVPRLGAALVLVGLVADLYLFVSKFTPQVRPEILQIKPRVIEIMRAGLHGSRILALGQDPIRRMAPNTPMLVGLEDVQGSDSLEVGAYRQMLTAASTAQGNFPQPDPSLPLMDLLGVRFVHSAMPLEQPGKLRLLFHDEGYLYENPRVLPRAFTVPQARLVTPEEALRRVTARDFRPQDAVLLSGPEPAGKAGLRSCPCRVSSVRHGTNAVTIRGQFSPGCYVVLADTYYPGWRAYEGDTEAPILRAYYALRAVPVLSDCREIRLLYVPGSFWVGGFLTCLGMGLLAGALGLQWAPRWTRP